MSTETAEPNVTALLQALQETTQRVQSSLETGLDDHLTSQEFQTTDGLDFLDTKNSLLLSYLIELTLQLRQRLVEGDTQSITNWHRLMELKTALDKLRGLDKKLKYQIDKILSAAGGASFAAAGDDEETKQETAVEDPLQYRPNADALEDDDSSDSSSSSSSSADDSSEGEDAPDSKRPKEDDEDDLDEDLATARMTLNMAKYGQKSSSADKKDRGSGEEEPSIYRAPRLSAAPYAHDAADRQAEREKRQRRRMRTSELAQTLRSQYGDAPEAEDIQGGSQLGRQRQAARRLAEREMEKTKFEEETMIRLTTTRKEKKERQRLMREESSNLAAIADLGNLVREAEFGDERRQKSRRDPASGGGDRHLNGKRKRHRVDADGQSFQQQYGDGRKKKSFKAKNSFQEALFAGDKKGRKASKKRT